MFDSTEQTIPSGQKNGGKVFARWPTRKENALRSKQNVNIQARLDPLPLASQEPLFSPLARLLSFASLRFGKNIPRDGVGSCPVSISSPFIPPEAAHAYDFAFSLISLEQARANAEIVFRKEAFEDLSTNLNAQVRNEAATSSRHERQFATMRLSITSVSGESVSQPLLSRWLSHEGSSHQMLENDDISIYSTAVTDEAYTPVLNRAEEVFSTTGISIRCGSHDFASEVSFVLSNVSGDMDSSFSRSLGEEFAPARDMLAARTAVRYALAREAADI